jgi:hypothetical protein
LRHAYRDGRFTLVTSEPLLSELEDVLARPRLVRKYQLDPDEVSGLLRLLRDQAVIVRVRGGDGLAAGAKRGRKHSLPYFWKVAPHLALTEEGPQTVVYRHLESIRMVAAHV